MRRPVVRVMLATVAVLSVLAGGPGPAASQDGGITGRVEDALTGRPLAQVDISVVEVGTAGEERREGAAPSPVATVRSGPDGRFTVPGIRPGLYAVRATALGYADARVADVRVQSSRPSFVLVRMNPGAIELQGITVGGGAFRVPEEAPVSGALLTPAEVRRTPGGLQDISRTLLSLPGVVGGVDNRNDLLVRGGGPGENAYYLDGIRIPQINHFATQGAGGGALGLVNVDFIREVEFYRGAFPVRYPEALSSVLVIENRPGTPDGIRGDVTLGASEAGLTLDGPLGGDGSWLFSVRRSYLQFLFQAIGLPIRPDYWDGQTRVEWRPTDRDRLLLVGIGAVDDFDIVAPEAGDVENQEIFQRVIDNDQRSGTVGASWERSFDDGLLRLVASHSIIDYRFRDVDADGAVVLRNRSLEKRTPLRLEGERRLGSSAELSGGLLLARAAVEADVLQRVTPGSPLTGDVRYDTSLEAWEPGAFLQAGTEVLDGRLRLTAGLRWDRAGGLIRGDSWSPRASARLRLSSRWSVSAGGGRYHQAPPLISRAVAVDGVRVNRELLPIRNDQAVLGVAFEPDEATRLSLEGFWKDYARYPVLAADPRISLANLGGDYGFVGAEPLLPVGRGRATGVELFGQRRLAGGIFALGAYTLSRSEFSGSDGVLRPSAWDVRHALDLTLGYRPSTRWEFGTKVRFLSGRPFTPFDDAASAAEFPVTGRGVPDWGRVGAERTPAYLRLDVRGERRFEFDSWNAVLFLDVQNILNRENPVGYRYTQDPAFPDNRRPIDGSALLPFFGFSVEF